MKLATIISSAVHWEESRDWQEHEEYIKKMVHMLPRRAYAVSYSGMTVEKGKESNTE